MELLYAKNPQWADVQHSAVTLTVRFSEIDEELPFTATPEDCEAHGREIFANAIRGEYGPVAEYRPLPSEQMSAVIRMQRDDLLAQSDWTQLPDAQQYLSDSKKALWVNYRQQLRDLPQQDGFPYSVAWPVRP